ncbi:MAG: aminotransferase class I/II-fold pyridoxal phosphate-dependent enzyme [bacterium]
MESKTHGFGTIAIHAGEPSDMSGIPIYQVATYHGEYTREDNPTIAGLEQKIAALEGGEKAMAAASGMAAISHTLLALLQAGDRLICHYDVYISCFNLFKESMPRVGIEIVPIDMRDLNQLKEALLEETQVVYVETISNPTLDISDIKAIAEIAHEADAKVVVDNTFLTPYLLRPFELGADVVIHSATKFLSGHGDSVGGLVISDEETITAIKKVRSNYGGIISPFNAFLIMRGMKTLPLRIAQHCANALAVSEFLSQHPKVTSVRYGALKSDPDHDIAAHELPKGCGGMVGFILNGAAVGAKAFVSNLKICKNWVSLGDVQTLVIWHDEEPERRVPEGYLRLSVGLEDIEDIIEDLTQALDCVP